MKMQFRLGLFDIELEPEISSPNGVYVELRLLGTRIDLPFISLEPDIKLMYYAW